MSIRSRIQLNLRPYPTIAIWGAGGLGRTALRYWLPINKIKFVIDANAWSGQKLGEYAVNSPDAVDISRVDAVVICAGAHVAVRRDLLARGYKGAIVYVYELFLPSDDSHLSELQALAIDIAITKNDPWPLFLGLKPQIFVNFTFRIGNWSSIGWWKRPIHWLFFLLHHCACLLLSIQLPLGTAIGPGLLFAHYGTIVFTRRATIGSFFTIYHGCTVGTNDSGQAPIIGDFVSQYAGSHVLGRCRIGDRSRIGANAVATNLECGAESTVVGIPAHIVQRG
jgi:serine acetyltransferase